MNGNTRTKRSLKNMQTALLFYIINLVLAFISRKVFIDHLGIEVLGLNTTATNILGFLNIAELGIGSAISYTLYHPLFEKDRQMVNEIVSVQGWLYRKVAYVMILGACILIFFFPLIFKKMELPMWYAYASFIVLLVSSLFGYFINYRQIVLIADQKEYNKFHKFLIKNGYIMMQESVYTKLALNNSIVLSEKDKLKKNKPPKGLVQLLVITEKQFSRIEYLVGDKKTDIEDTESRLIIL